MPALNFKKQFAELVRTGQKTQTVRAKRKDKRDPVVGQKLYLYTGMRTAHCKKLGEGICTSVDTICIHAGGIDINAFLSSHREADFIKADGFSSRQEFFNFFRTVHGLPFWGLLIKWKYILPAPCLWPVEFISMKEILKRYPPNYLLPVKLSELPMVFMVPPAPLQGKTPL